MKDSVAEAAAGRIATDDGEPGGGHCLADCGPDLFAKPAHSVHVGVVVEDTDEDTIGNAGRGAILCEVIGVDSISNRMNAVGWAERAKQLCLVFTHHGQCLGPF